MINNQIAYFDREGKPTVEGLKYFKNLDAKLAAIAAVTAPSGGGTVDTEARTAISDIITAAGT